MCVVCMCMCSVLLRTCMCVVCYVSVSVVHTGAYNTHTCLFWSGVCVFFVCAQVSV